MPEPRAIVIPFGVPADGRGLGLGVAALVHTVVRVEGHGVAIAQLHAGPQGDGAGVPQAPVEAFVSPAAWREIAGRGDGPSSADVIITGSFDPPLSGSGTLQILAFDARDGRTRARVDARVDEDHAGAALLAAIETLGSHLGGRIGGAEGLGELHWESLESVLRAERCALHDPERGGPHDRLAAMAHLGRAIGDAPEAAYPVDRLVALALETATGSAPLDPKLLSAAIRAIERAADDAPSRAGLMEALGALRLRGGQAKEAERTLSGALASAPGRARLYTLLAQALRAQRDFDGALSVLASGPPGTRDDASFVVERAMVYADRGDLKAAAAEWRHALTHDPVQPVAFCGLAGIALHLRDAPLAQSLVDAALAAPRAHPDVLRRAIHMALASEESGLARSSRVARLCAQLEELAPGDVAALLAWAQALLVLGEPAEARSRLARIEKMALRSAAAAEAQVVRLSLDDPGTDAEVRSVLRAAHGAPPSSLSEVSARARKLGTMHGAWSAWLAAGVADRRRGRLEAARQALEVALEMAPGATPAHLEMAGLMVALGDPRGGVSHAERAIVLEGESPRALEALARALGAAGDRPRALAAATRALAMRPDDEGLRSLVDGLRQAGEAPKASGWARWRR
jgi:tetratricopeptide (TPR) repeat protein